MGAFLEETTLRVVADAALEKGASLEAKEVGCLFLLSVDYGRDGHNNMIYIMGKEVWQEEGG